MLSSANHLTGSCTNNNQNPFNVYEAEGPVWEPEADRIVMVGQLVSSRRTMFYLFAYKLTTSLSTHL